MEKALETIRHDPSSRVRNCGDNVSAGAVKAPSLAKDLPGTFLNPAALLLELPGNLAVAYTLPPHSGPKRQLPECETERPLPGPRPPNG